MTDLVLKLTKSSSLLLRSQQFFTSTISFFRDGQLDTLALWKRDQWLFSTNNKDVSDTSSKSSVKDILDMDDFKTTLMLFTMSNDTNTTHVITTSDIANISRVKLDKFSDFTSFQINLDGVVDLDQWVWVTDGTTIVSNGIWDSLGTELDLFHLGKLVLGFFFSDAMDGETTLDIIDETKVFTSLFNGDDIYSLR